MDSTELTQFGLKQLFYQVKQSFPEVPDAVVNMCIRKVTFKHCPLFVSCTNLLSTAQAGYDRQAAEALLTREAPKYGRAPLLRKSPQGPAKSAGNSPVAEVASKVPPPLPVTPPVAASGGPSPPVYTSPLYRPDIDLSLPPPDIRQASQVQLFPRSSTSVNVILQPPTDYVTYAGTQLKITISPQGGTVVQRSSYSPNSLTDQSKHIQEQLAKRETLRSSLEEDKQRLVSLRKKVELLQEELAKAKCLLGQPVGPPPFYRQQAVTSYKF